jgi:type VI secretion system protein ImpG
MSLNYVSLANERHFRELLRVYDFQAEYDAQRALAQGRLLEGITRIRSTFAERVLRGAPVRGCEIEMELDEDHFAGEGDAFLFASVLNRFFSLYVTLNSFSQFTARFRRSGRIYRFAPRWGDQLTPVEEREGALA